jgi:hypothetical protein
VEASGADRGRPGAGHQELEPDELAEVRMTIAALEAELEITTAAVVLFNGEGEDYCRAVRDDRSGTPRAI